MKTNYRTAANAGTIKIRETHSMRRNLAKMSGKTFTSGGAYRAWMNSSAWDLWGQMIKEAA
jgi:hypothetical protein